MTGGRTDIVEKRSNPDCEGIEGVSAETVCCGKLLRLCVIGNC